MTGPLACGGAAASAPTARRVSEILAGACGVTHFVQAQHHGPVALLAGSKNSELRERFLRPMCEGRLLAGVAFSHLRRAGPPAVTATPTRGGFIVAGEAPWVTSWGLAEIFAIAARTPDDRILYFAQCAPEQDSGGGDAARLSASRHDLFVMNASSTVSLRMRDLFVPEDRVIRMADLNAWRERDRINTAQTNPAVFGIAETCLDLLASISESHLEVLSRAEALLRDEGRRCRAEAYGLADGDPSPADVPNLLRVKAWSLDYVARAAQALVAATGGRAMSLNHPAQRLLREAIFYTIQAQTAASRDSSLELLVRAGNSGIH